MHFPRNTKRRSSLRRKAMVGLLTLASITAATVSIDTTSATADTVSPTDCSVITNCLVIAPGSAVAYGGDPRRQILDFAGAWDAPLAGGWGSPNFYGSNGGQYVASKNQQWSYIPEVNTGSWSPSAATMSPPPGSFQIVNVEHPGYCLYMDGRYTGTASCSGTDPKMAFVLEPVPGGAAGSPYPYDLVYLIRGVASDNCLNQQGGSDAIYGYGGQSHSDGYPCNSGDQASYMHITHVSSTGNYQTTPSLSGLLNQLDTFAGIAGLSRCAANNDCQYGQTSISSSTTPGQCIGQVYQNTGVANETVNIQYQYSTQTSQTTGSTYTYGTSVTFKIGTPPTSDIALGLEAGFSFSYAKAFSVTQGASNVWSAAQTVIIPPGYFFWLQSDSVTQTLSGAYTFKRNSWNSWTWTPKEPITTTSFGSVINARTALQQPNSVCLSAQTAFHPI